MAIRFKPSNLHGSPKVVPQTPVVRKLYRAPPTPHSQTHDCTSRSSAKPLFQQLLWLPVKDCINYNLALLAHKVQTFTWGPDYYSWTTSQFHNNRSLRSHVVSFDSRGPRSATCVAGVITNRVELTAKCSEVFSLVAFKRRLNQRFLSVLLICLNFSSLDSNNNWLKLSPAQCLLDIVHSARNIGFIFDENLTFSDQISAHATQIAIVVNFVVSVHILISDSQHHCYLYRSL